MKKHLALSFTLLIVAPLGAPAREPLDLKPIPLTEFMQSEISISIGLPIPVPREYEPADLDAPVTYAYWMRSRDAKKATRTGSLPSWNGYMYGKISLDVGYDEESDLFIGVEDEEFLSATNPEISSLTIERCRYQTHPVLLLRAQAVNANSRAYAVYIATGAGTSTVYVALRPPRNSREAGEQFLNALKSSLTNCRTIRSKPGSG